MLEYKIFITEDAFEKSADLVQDADNGDILTYIGNYLKLLSLNIEQEAHNNFHPNESDDIEIRRGGTYIYNQEIKNIVENNPEKKLTYDDFFVYHKNKEIKCPEFITFLLLQNRIGWQFHMIAFVLKFFVFYGIQVEFDKPAITEIEQDEKNNKFSKFNVVHYEGYTEITYSTALYFLEMGKNEYNYIEAGNFNSKIVVYDNMSWKISRADITVNADLKQSKELFAKLNENFPQTQENKITINAKAISEYHAINWQSQQNLSDNTKPNFYQRHKKKIWAGSVLVAVTTAATVGILGVMVAGLTLVPALVLTAAVVVVGSLLGVIGGAVGSMFNCNKNTVENRETIIETKTKPSLPESSSAQITAELGGVIENNQKVVETKVVDSNVTESEVTKSEVTKAEMPVCPLTNQLNNESSDSVSNSDTNTKCFSK